MDTKSLAKSKRAHTQHHNKKPHAVHKAKGLASSENSKNPEKNQTTKTPIQSRRITALPSNWDRYDNNEDDEEPELSKTDTVVAKSKGGDYVHLLSEAKAVSFNSDSLSLSLDDLLHDEFSRGVGSMISASGEGLLSWMEDDNFVVGEDGSSSYHEPGFLSLDLNALERTLEKVDLHERLYLEADLLPPEMCTSESELSQCRSHITRDAEGVTLRQESTGDTVSVVEAESGDQVNEIPIKTGQSEKTSAIEADLDFLLDSVCSNSSATNKNPTVPKSSGVETELDSLLDSHNGAEADLDLLLESVCSNSSATNKNPSVSKSSAFETELDSLLDSHSGTEAFNKPVKPSTRKIQPADFDDELDDLLESTSVSIKPQQDQTTSSPSVGNSKVLDEFDSWIGTI